MRAIYIIGLTSLLASLTSCGQKCNELCVEETYVHKYGVAVPPGFWSESGKDGAVISTMADGVVVTRSYRGGLLDGDTCYSFPHSSQTETTETYTQGTLVKTTSYYFDGTAKSEVSYDCPLGMRRVSSWYLSGTPRSVEQYSGDEIVSGEYFDPSNNRDAFVVDSKGERLIRDDYGHLLATDTIEGGRFQSRTTYHPNGAPKEHIAYNAGVREGVTKTYYPAGEPATVEQWVNGKQHGLTTIYQNGDKCADVVYEKGVKQGKEIRYRDGTIVVQEAFWQDDKQHGPTVTYVGDNTKTDWYHKGDKVSKTDFDAMNRKSGSVH